jgi:hypothetical protein
MSTHPVENPRGEARGVRGRRDETGRNLAALKERTSMAKTTKTPRIMTRHEADVLERVARWAHWYGRVRWAKKNGWKESPGVIRAHNFTADALGRRAVKLAEYHKRFVGEWSDEERQMPEASALAPAVVKAQPEVGR